MTRNPLLSFKVHKYKCFVSENQQQGFEEIKPINVIIGKNNSGKSKILEALHSFMLGAGKDETLKVDNFEGFSVTKQLSESELRKIFRENTITDELGPILIGIRENWMGIGRHLIGKTISASNGKIEILDHSFTVDTPQQKNAYKICTAMLRQGLANPLSDYIYLSIRAERDIKKEAVTFNKDEYYTSPDGSGITGLIVRCLQEEKGHAKGWQELIEKTLLTHINSVLAPDIKFSRIYSKIGDQNQHEIYFEEEHKGGIKLSDHGSGIKTVVMVMTALYVLPQFISKKPNFVFSFEELENNLHPSLERRLLAHIRDYIEENPDNFLFLTTHSNVAINLFSKDPNAQILSVKNDGRSSSIQRVDNWKEHHNLLNDLGVKASDLLQANCIVWLEGPSDRIYFNKWIDIFNEGKKLEEELHYQCVFYGGGILSHFSADSDGGDKKFIQILKVNRNSIIMMDSDKNIEDGALKPRVTRILSEAESCPNIFTWVTAGREVENYIPNNVLETFFGQNPKLRRFDSVPEKYKGLKQVKTFDKVGFASSITSQNNFNRESLKEQLDLQDRVIKMIEHIKKCNS